MTFRIVSLLADGTSTLRGYDPAAGLWRHRGMWSVPTTVESMSIDVRRPLAVDLFAGAGGLSLGLEQAGYEIAAAVEYDPIHAAVHEFNFPYGKTFCADVSKITGQKIRDESEIGNREIHLVAGGPPCQGISMIGRRAIDDPRNALLKEFVRVVLELRPRYFLM